MVTVRVEDEPSWAEVVRRAEHGESVSVIAHGDHVADVVPSGELDRGMYAGDEALTAAWPGVREAESLAWEVCAAGEPVRRIAGEQAALRRVGALVARGGPPGGGVAAVAAGGGGGGGGGFTFLSRSDPA